MIRPFAAPGPALTLALTLTAAAPFPAAAQELGLRNGLSLQYTRRTVFGSVPRSRSS